MLNSMGVPDSASVILTAGRQEQVDLHLLLILSGQPVMETLPSPRTRTTASAPAPSPPPPSRGRRRPSAPGPGPCLYPDTYLIGRPVEWSRNRRSGWSQSGSHRAK